MTTEEFIEHFGNSGDSTISQQAAGGMNYNTLPKTAKKVERFAAFKVRVFNVVPDNAHLLCYNKFTGHYSYKGSGFRINLPWVESKLVTKSTITVDYKAQNVSHKKGDVLVDAVINYRIVEPVKNETASADFKQQLYNQTNNIVRLYIANYDEIENLLGKRINISEFINDPDYTKFTIDNGIELESITIDSINLSGEIRKSLEYITKAELERKKELIEAETRVRIAKLNSEKRQIEGEAEAKVLEYQAKALMGAGLSADQIRDYFYSLGQNTNIIANYGNSSLVTEIATGVTAVENNSKRRILAKSVEQTQKEEE